MQLIRNTLMSKRKLVKAVRRNSVKFVGVLLNAHNAWNHSFFSITTVFALNFTISIRMIQVASHVLLFVKLAREKPLMSAYHVFTTSIVFSSAVFAFVTSSTIRNLKLNHRVSTVSVETTKHVIEVLFTLLNKTNASNYVGMVSSFRDNAMMEISIMVMAAQTCVRLNQISNVPPKKEKFQYVSLWEQFL